jgi:hypothetical protein
MSFDAAALPDHLDDVREDDPAPRSGPLQFARMSGSSIAGRDAAAWITDFLNAAYYRCPSGARDVDDLRLAFCIITTAWYRKPAGQRLRLTDLPAFHRAFGADRFDTSRSARGVLDREQLLEGAARLLGPWFPEAYADPERRGWGIAFPTVADRDAYDPGRRLALARVGRLTPERAPLDQQVWHTYPPVEMPSAEGVVGALTRPETWPDYASEIGRFTPLRPGGLLGQTFEIEVAAGTASGLPIFTRGYVTVTRLVTPDDPDELAAYFEEVEEGLAHYGDDEPRAVPEGGQPVVGPGPDHPRGPLHGQRAQPPAPLHPRGTRVGAGGRHVGSHAVAPRAGLPAGRQRRPARVLGAGRGRGAEHAPPARAQPVPRGAGVGSSAWRASPTPPPGPSSSATTPAPPLRRRSA